MKSPLSLPPAARLRTKREFDAVFEQGARVNGQLLAVLVRKSAGEESRIGIPCGKRFSKRAVDRNRFRRLIREVFRLHRREWKSPVEVVVLPRCRPAQCNFQLFEKEFLQLVAKAARKYENTKPATGNKDESSCSVKS